MADSCASEPHEQWLLTRWRDLGSFCSTIELHPRSVHFTRVEKKLANTAQPWPAQQMLPVKVVAIFVYPLQHRKENE